MNANDHFKKFTSTEHYYKLLGQYVYTDGVKELCNKFSCYWFLDIVVSYQPQLKHEDFQVWKLKRQQDNSAIAVCTDGNKRELVRQVIEFTDFEPIEATLWVEGTVILLPSEH